MVWYAGPVERPDEEALCWSEVIGRRVESVR